MTHLHAAQVQRGQQLQVPKRPGGGLDPELVLISCKKKLHPKKAENSFGRALVGHENNENNLDDLAHKYCHVTLDF